MKSIKKKARAIPKKTPKKKTAPSKAKIVEKKVKPLQEKDLGKNGKFHKTVSKLIGDFNQQLSQAGFSHKLSKVAFDSQPEDLVCRCGIETVKNPETGIMETRCTRCPPPLPPPQ